MKQDIVKFNMSPYENVSNSVNLYIYNEKNIYTREHTHSFFEFIIIVQGNAIQAVNGKEYPTANNDICILRPESIHSVIIDDQEPLLLFNFEVSTEYFEQLYKALGFETCEDVLPSLCRVLHCHAEDIMRYLQIITIPNKAPANRVVVRQSSLKIVLADILIKVLSSKDVYPSKHSTDPINTILSYLGNTEYFQLSIKEICEKTFYTQEHVTRLFSKAKLAPPSKIHLQNKLHYAAYLLINSDMKIEAITKQCGIKTMSYFNKAFKKEYGVPPRTYQKMYMRSKN